MLMKRELEAAKRHPHSIARAQVTDAALMALCVLECIRQGVYAELDSTERDKEVERCVAVIELAIEVLRG